mmetsp:Transcript_26196/g.49431  ORF Transcript_26196/g.49431 Transcript_26196/m.49431 type:complete len:636 (-) Transcript_26196:463-2370(-)
MIKYRTRQGSLSFFRQVCQRAGSVFPEAFQIALPCMALTVALTILINEKQLQFLENEDSVLRDNAAWGGFSFLVGFLIVFRTSQSYNRFWEGCQSTHHMRAEWFDGCSSLIAFCKHSKADKGKVSHFQNTLVRLFSMLHAAALAEIEDCAGDEVSDYEAFNFALLDAEGIDEKSLLVIKSSTAKVELIFQWIQQLVVENIETSVLSIPPPILSRSFQEIANGMVAFHDAMKISYIPFPFPYAQTCDFLLLLHWFIVPFVVCQWVTEPVWAAVFSFIQVFILWALNFIAVELENPFGLDANDIDGWHMQEEMNEHLLLLMSPSTKTTPTLSTKCKDLSDLSYWMGDSRDTVSMLAEKSFSQVWNALESIPPGDAMCSRASVRPPARRSRAVSMRHSSATMHNCNNSRASSRASRYATTRRSRLSTDTRDTTYANSSVRGSNKAPEFGSGSFSIVGSSIDEEVSRQVSDEKMVVFLGDQTNPHGGGAGMASGTKSRELDIEDTPNEPAPKRIQKVHVLDKSNLKPQERGGSFFRAEELLQQFVVDDDTVSDRPELREDTLNSDRPTTAPHSIQGLREDTNASSRVGADSANSISSAGSQEAEPMGQVLYNMFGAEIQRQTNTRADIESAEAQQFTSC